MAVYLYTYHAYRTWGPDRRQGYVKPGKGILPHDHVMAKHYDRAAKHAPVAFDSDMQRVIVEAVRRACHVKGWRLHCICANATHVHILVSWGGFEDWKTVSDTLKRWIGKELSKALNRKGPWLSRGQSRKRVTDRKHFDHLMQTYLPQHDGVYWRE